MRGQHIFSTHYPPQGEVNTFIAAMENVINFQDKNGKQHFEGMFKGSGTCIAEAWSKFIGADDARAILSWKLIQQCAVARRIVTPNIAGLPHCEVSGCADDFEEKGPEEQTHLLAVWMGSATTSGDFPSLTLVGRPWYGWS